MEFFNGSTKLGEASSSPYTFTWNSVAAGSYVLTAKATDNGNASTTSAAINITVSNASSVCLYLQVLMMAMCLPMCSTMISIHAGLPAEMDNGIQFCLGTSSVSVTGVQVAFYSGNTRTSTFDVLVGSDGTNWTTAAAGLVSSGTSTALETLRSRL